MATSVDSHVRRWPSNKKDLFVDLNHLTEAERDVILNVLQKDEDLQKAEEKRVSKLRSEIQILRRQGALKPGQDAEKTCTRCRSELGVIFNTGALCPKCHAKVCKLCREEVQDELEGWMCSLCYKQRQIKLQSGEWFYTNLIANTENVSKGPSGKVVLLGSDIVRASIRRGGKARTVRDTSFNSSIDEECSDTQSTADGNSKDTDKTKLLDLVKGFKSESPEQPRVVVRKVTSKGLDDSDSSDSGPDSPKLSSQRRSPSIKSSSAISSDRTTIISTSDEETPSRTHDVRKKTRHRSPGGHDIQMDDVQAYKVRGQGQLKIDKINNHPPTKNRSDLQGLKESNNNTVPLGAAERKPGEAHRDEDFTVEELTQVKFKRCSTRRDNGTNVSPRVSKETSLPPVDSSYEDRSSSGSWAGEEEQSWAGQQPTSYSTNFPDRPHPGTNPSLYSNHKNNHLLTNKSTSRSITVNGHFLTQHEGKVGEGDEAEAPLTKRDRPPLRKSHSFENPLFEEDDEDVSVIKPTDPAIDSDSNHESDDDERMLIELRNALKDSLENQHIEGDESLAKFKEADTRGDILDDDDILMEMADNIQKLNTLKEKQPSQDDAMSDTLSIITEVTEPGDDISMRSVSISEYDEEQKAKIMEFYTKLGIDGIPISSSESTAEESDHQESLTDANRHTEVLATKESFDETDAKPHASKVAAEKHFQKSKSSEKGKKRKLKFFKKKSKKIDKDSSSSNASSVGASFEDVVEQNLRKLDRTNSNISNISLDIPDTQQPMQGNAAQLSLSSGGEVPEQPKTVSIKETQIMATNVHPTELASQPISVVVSPSIIEPHHAASGQKRRYERTEGPLDNMGDDTYLNVSDLVGKWESLSPHSKRKAKQVYTDTVKGDPASLLFQQEDMSPRVRNEAAPCQTEIPVKDMRPLSPNIGSKTDHVPDDSDSTISFDGNLASSDDEDKDTTDHHDALVDDISALASSKIEDDDSMEELQDAGQTPQGKPPFDSTTSVCLDDQDTFQRAASDNTSEGIIEEADISTIEDDGNAAVTGTENSLPEEEMSNQDGTYVEQQASKDSAITPEITSTPLHEPRRPPIGGDRKLSLELSLSGEGQMNQNLSKTDSYPSRESSSSSDTSVPDSPSASSTSSRSRYLLRYNSSPAAAVLDSSSPPPKPLRRQPVSVDSGTFPADEIDAEEPPEPISAQREVEQTNQPSNGHATRTPSISVTSHDANEEKGFSEELTDTFKEDENIDELFAAHRSIHSSTGNLHVSFGGSQGSLSSYYSNAGEDRYGNIPVSGEILLGMEYDYKKGWLVLHIKRCQDLAPADVKKNRSDPYVKVYLLPDKTRAGKRKTKIKKHTLNPTYDESLRYIVTKSELETRTLWLSVWHSDTFGHNEFLGEVLLPLNEQDFDDTSPRWYQLSERIAEEDTSLAYRGDLSISVKFVPPEYVTGDSPHKSKKKSKKSPAEGKKGQLHVMIREAKNLMAMKTGGTSDPFCKGYLLPEKSKQAKQKTKVIKKNCNPKWNETLLFEDLTLEELEERCLELTVWDHDLLTSNDFLGGARLGLGTGRSYGREVIWMDSRGEEISVWQNMLDHPNDWADVNLMLRATMGKST